MSRRTHPTAGDDGGFLGDGRFSVERTLGEGSMGFVYLAYDQKRRAQVAIKTLRRVDSSGIYRFKREFRALADLRHPSLVQLYELFADEGDWYFSMEYVDGEPLMDRLIGAEDWSSVGQVGGTRQLKLGRRGTGAARPKSPVLDEGLLRNVFSQIAQALLFVHGAGRLHRDLKPDNLLVTAEGRAVLLDFGIALQLTDQAQRTFEAGVMGTPAYMSPEQAAGDAVTAATDWYAFGVMLYQALTGGVPFDGNYLQVLKSKQAVDPPQPTELVDGVPEDLNDLCMSLLARDPHARPDGAHVLRALAADGADCHRSVPPVSAVGMPELVGRDVQLQALWRAITATEGGRPVLSLVQGGTGLGKTALLDRFAAELREAGGVTVLSGRCYERELVPYKAFDGVMDSLSRHLRAAPIVAAADAMPMDAKALTALFPVLERAPIFGQVRRRRPAPSEADALRSVGLSALREVLRRLSHQQPLAVIVDDLQWGDLDSARLIASLLSGPDSPAALFLFTYRQADVKGSACLKTLFEHTRENHQLEVRHVTLSPIPDVDLRRILEQAYGDELRWLPGDLDDLVAEANGNPYFLHEAVQRAQLSEGSGEGAATAHGAQQARVEALSEPARELLQLVSVSGRPLSERFLVQVCGGEAARTHQALSELREAKLVRGVGTVDEPAVDAYHEGLRQVVRASLSDDEVSSMHRRMADALERSDAMDLRVLTEHLIGAQEFRRAGTYAIRAAVQAMRAHSFESAADLYSLAVEHCDDDGWRRDLRLQWASALAACGRSAEAGEVYGELADQSEGDEATELSRHAGLQWLLCGHAAQGRSRLRATVLAQGLDLPEYEGDAIELAWKIHQEIVDGGFAFDKRELAELNAKQVQQFDELWDVANGLIHFDPYLSLPVQLKALQAALVLGHVPRLIAALCLYHMHFECVACIQSGQPARGLALAEALAHEGGAAKERAYVAMARGIAHLQAGLYRPAVLHLQSAEELFRTRCRAWAGELRMCRQYIAYLFGVLGQFNDFHLVEQWIREADRKRDLLSGVHLRLLAGVGALAEDDTDRARHYMRATERWAEAQLGVTSMLVRLCRSRVALYTADGEVARMATRPGTREPTTVGGVPAYRAESLLQRARVLLLRSQLATETAVGDDDPARTGSGGSTLGRLVSSEQDTRDGAGDTAFQAQIQQAAPHSSQTALAAPELSESTAARVDAAGPGTAATQPAASSVPAALEGPDVVAALLEEAEGCLVEVLGAGIPHYADHATLCRAGLHALRGQHEQSLAALGQILREAEQIGDGPMLLACANIRRGQLMPQKEGKPLIESGLRRLSTLGIRRPEVFIRVYAPGFNGL